MLTLLLPLLVQAGELPLQERVDWPAFMARHDMVWTALPGAWHEGAFVGNGLLGAMIYRDVDSGGVRWDIGRSDAVERHPNGNHRLPIGELLLQPAGAITAGDMRLDLWNAETTGTLSTDRGSIGFRSFTHAEEPVTVIELTVDGEAPQWVWRPQPAVNPRLIARNEELKTANPEGRQVERAGATVWLQPLAAGGEIATAWREGVDGDRRLLFLSTGYATENGAGESAAVAAVTRAAAQRFDELVDSHRAWWHGYWPQSFVSLPDTRMESFYWLQMYKLGSATRADRPAIDLMGPWYRVTPWPAIWWNLNIQLTYWPVYTSGRLHLGESLTNMIDAGAEQLAANAPEAWRDDSAVLGRTSSYDLRSPAWKEHGNLTWALHNYWLQYRHTMDEAMLRERLYPLLRRAVGYYLHILERGDDGRLHVPQAISPEYPDEARDTNYDLSLLRWGLRTLLASAERLNLDDPLIPTWRQTLADLTPYPTDATGLMIGAGVPLAESHRHFSHLLMVYPLHLMTGDTPEERALIERSLAHWIGFEGALQGYSFTGASAISSILGKGDDAAGYLNEFLDRFVKPNTMYLEAGPVIETPLAAAAAIHDMLLQSWGERVRVFPAVASDWADVSFHRLSAEGGFRVSAGRRDGRTRWVAVESLAGEPLTLQADLGDAPQVVGLDPGAVTPAGDGVWQIELPKGGAVALLAAGVEPPLTVDPVDAQPGRTNLYGSRKATAVLPADDGSLWLHAARAAVHGDKLFYEKTATKDNLGRWIDADDWAEWAAMVPRPGQYDVSVTYAAPRGVDGGTFAVQVGDETLTHVVQNTGAWDTFQTFDLGTVTIEDAGMVPVTVKVAEMKSGALCNFQGVRLVPR